jgi:putative ABC transport system permease protein
MLALWRVAARDLRGRRLPTALFFLVVAVAATGITAGLAQQRSAAERWDDAFRRANGAHVALYGDATALRRIRADPEVVQAAGPSPVAFATLVRGSERIDDFEVRAAGPQRQAVGTPLLFGGRWLSGRDPREVVVERSFALAEDIAPGDRVRLSGPAGALTLDVVGVALNLVDCFYPECESQTAWTTGAAVDRLARSRDRDSLLLARVARPDAVGAFTARAERSAGTGIRDLEDWEGTRGDALRLNQFFGAFLASFGVFLLVAAGLVILSAVSARVLARYREMGMLKAVGFTPRSLALLVLGENLAIAAVGAVAGVVAGALLAPTLQLRFSEVLERGSATFPAGVLGGAIVVVLVIVVAATLLRAGRASRVPASQAIARGAAPVSTRPSRVAALAVRLRLGAATVAGIKDAGARPLRAWLTVGALAITVVAFVAALAMDHSFSRIAGDPALAGTPQGITVEPGRAAPAEIAARLGRVPGVETWFTATERHAAVGTDTFQLRALGGDLAGTGYVVRDGRMIARPGEAVVGYGLERRLGLHVGDRLALTINGRRLRLRVVGRYARARTPASGP